MASNPRTKPTDGDEGKDVVDTDGETVGVVSAVEEGTLFVDVDPGIVESVTAGLGWGDADGSKPIPKGRIERIDEGEVVIRTAETLTDEHGDEAGSDAPAGKYADAEPGEGIDDPDPTGMEDPGAGVPGTGDPGRVDPGEEERSRSEDGRPEAEDGARPEEPGGPGGATDDR